MGNGRDKKEKGPPKQNERSERIELIGPAPSGGSHDPGRVPLHGSSSSSSRPACPYIDSPEREMGTIVIGYHDNSGLPSRQSEGLHPSPRYHDSLVEIASSDGYGMGFDVQKGWGSKSGEVWLRDIQIVLADGSLLFPFAGDDYEEGKSEGRYLKCSLFVDMDVCTKALLAPDGYVACEEHLDYGSVPLKVFGTPGLVRHAQEAAIRAGHPCWKGKTYIEGGNILVARKANGRTGAIIGEASLIQSMLALEVQLLFDPMVVAKRERRLEGALDSHRHLIPRLTAAVFAEGSPSSLFAILLGELPSNKKGFEADARHLLRYLAKLDITKDYIAAELGLEREDLTFVEQPAFHLDMAMAVGPNGCVLLQSYTESSKVLKKMLDRRDDFDPSSPAHRERNIRVELGARRVITRTTIKRYYYAACRMAPKLHDIELRIKQQLEDGGYQVHLAAGVFAEQADRLVAKDSSMPINFFNNVSGTRRGHGVEEQMFYITNGTGCDDDNLGDLFRTHWWKKVCKPLGYDMVFFIANLDGLAQASLATAGGLRCLTCVLPPTGGGRRRVFRRTLSRSDSSESIRSKGSDDSDRSEDQEI